MAKVTQVNNGDSGLMARTNYNEAIKDVETDATITGDGINTPLSAVPDSKKADKVTGATPGNLAALDASGNLTDSGSVTDDFATDEQGALADSATQPGDNVSTLTNDANYASTDTAQTDWIGGLIESPSDKDYNIILKAPYAGTITETTTICTSGTCTATFKIGATPLGGTANSVSSTEESQAHASANSFIAGDDIVMTISANSSTVDMRFTVTFTYNLQ